MNQLHILRQAKSGPLLTQKPPASATEATDITTPDQRMAAFQNSDPDHTVAHLAGRLSIPDGITAPVILVNTVEKIIDWVDSRWPGELGPDARLSSPVDLREDQHHFTTLPANGRWAATYAYPDAQHPEDRWRHEFLLTGSETEAWIHYRGIYKSVSGEPPVAHALPDCIRALLVNPGVLDGHHRLSESPINVRTESELRHLHELLEDSSRKLPLIVISASNDMRYPNASRYIINPSVTARDCVGLAHVAAIPIELGRAWTELVGAANTAYRGAVRIYPPGEDSASRSELHMAERIRIWRFRDLSGPSAYAQYLRQYLLELEAPPRTAGVAPPKAAATVDAASLARSQQLQKELDETRRQLDGATIRLREQERRLAISEGKVGDLEKLLESTDAKSLLLKLRQAQTRIEELETRHRADAKLITEYDRRVADMEDRVMSLEEDGERFLTDNVRLEAERGQLIQQIVELGHTPNLLAPTPAEAPAEADEATPVAQPENASNEIPIPRSLKELGPWAEKYLAGKLVLHPRALRAAKDSKFQDVPLVYKGLLLLANDYREMRLQEGGNSLKKEFEDHMHELGFSFQRSVNPDINGQRMNEYQVPWGDNKTGASYRLLEWMLRKGFSRDQRYMLCIYFFWDEDTKQVVVGSLPGHLETRFSN